MPLRLNQRDADFQATFAQLLTSRDHAAPSVTEVVSAIIAQVRARGDLAVYDYTKQFDRADHGSASSLRLTAREIADAVKECPSEVARALEFAKKRLEEYHARQCPQDVLYTDDSGTQLGWRWSAVQSVGLYVPGGLASYPSSVLHNAIPARMAGCKRVVMVVPTPDGALNAAVLFAAQLACIDEIYAIGGAQAIAALAYGTESIAPVDMIVGPGNAYVAEAKRQVFGKVGIDMIAGPSEICVVADKHNNPEWIAADLLSQAEHDPVAQSILITDDEAFAESVALSVDKILQTLQRKEIASASWQNHGAIIVVPTFKAAMLLVNQIAPEHLELALEDPQEWAKDVLHAGAIFMGRYTPEAIGDYLAGPSHVLPTSRTARFASGLSVYQFMKKTSMIGCSAESLQKIGGEAVTLATAEGLGAHALSVSNRLK